VQKLFQKYPIQIGIILAALTTALHQWVLRGGYLESTSVLLAIIAAIYYGFAVFCDGTKKARFVEVLFASFMILTAVLGWSFSYWIIVGALVVHGIWDLLHHKGNTLSLVRVPEWYPSFCAWYDFIIAGYLGVLLLSK